MPIIMIENGYINTFSKFFFEILYVKRSNKMTVTAKK